MLRVLAALCLLLLAGCAEQAAELSPADLSSLKTHFAAGDVLMTCGLGCSGSYGYHRAELKTLYTAGDWTALYQEAVSIGADNEQAWFYLASAAEGLGYDDAAQRYYFISLSTRFRCKSFINVCDGLDLPSLTEDRLTALDAKLLASADFSQRNAPPASPAEISLSTGHGLFEAPVLLDGKIPLRFAVDSGSSGVTIPAGLAVFMLDKGWLKQSDFTGMTLSVLGNGSTAPTLMFRIKTLQLGGLVIKNVAGSVSPGPGELLLGQSFLDRFKSWSIDNSRHLLILQPS